MTYLIGTDEAGYGPNLGPLVVAATLWRVPDALQDANLYDILRGTVSPQIPRAHQPHVVPIADSKVLYKSGSGLHALESGVFPALTAVRLCLTRWREIWPQLARGCETHLASIPWYRDFDIDLPLDAKVDQLGCRGEAFQQCLSQNGFELLAVRARVVFAEQFNASVDRLGGKGTLLSTLTIDLVNELMRPLGSESILVHCDKHGGRNRYGPLLQTHFPDNLIEVYGESRTQSLYRWGPTSRRVAFRFVAKGEGFLPSALASMVAKYLRELAMKAFNAFWQQRVPGVKPTAGYPVDARRFLIDIDGACRDLNIAKEQIWRKC